MMMMVMMMTTMIFFATHFIMCSLGDGAMSGSSRIGMAGAGSPPTSDRCMGIGAGMFTGVGDGMEMKGVTPNTHAHA